MSVSVILMSSAVSTALVDGVVSVLGKVFVLGVAMAGELSEKMTRALVGVDLMDLSLGRFEMTFIERFFE